MSETAQLSKWEERRLYAKRLFEVNSRIQRLLSTPNEPQIGGWASLMRVRSELVKQLRTAAK